MAWEVEQRREGRVFCGFVALPIRVGCWHLMLATSQGTTVSNASFDLFSRTKFQGVFCHAFLNRQSFLLKAQRK